MAKKTEVSNKKSTRRLFLGSFLPQLIIIFIACNLLYFIPMMVIKESVKTEIALVQERVTSSVMNMVHPAILSVDNIVKIMPRIENEKSMLGLVGYLSESNTNGDVYYATTTKLSEGGIWADKTNGFLLRDGSRLQGTGSRTLLQLRFTRVSSASHILMIRHMPSALHIQRLR